MFYLTGLYSIILRQEQKENMLKIGIIIILIQLSLIHSTNLDPSRNLQIVPSQNTFSGKNSLQSFHGTYLSGKPDGTVTLSYNVQGWEIWTWIGVSQNVYNWQSIHGTYLSARQDGTISLVKEPKQWELWKKIEKDGKIYWQSYHGNYLSGGIDMTMSLQPRAEGWEQWQFRGIDQIVIVKSSGPASIKSFHGSFLSGSFDKKVSLVNKVQNEEKWTWLWLGDDKFAWKSFHNTYLSARQDGSVTLQRLINDWEVWRRVDQNGKHLWKSFHGNYLSGTDNFKVLLQSFPQGWQEWQDGDNLNPNPNPNPNPTPIPPSGPQAPGTNLRIINSCPYTIWPGLLGLKNDNSPAFGNKNSPKPAGFQLKSGQQKIVSLSQGAISVRIWARTGCSYQTNNAWPDVKTRFLCQVGECGNVENKWDGTCYRSSGQGGNTLAELTMTADGHWYYDVSLVDGYTIPVTMNLVGKINKIPGVSDAFSCKPISCSPNPSFDQCPPELKKLSPTTNKPVSCYSINHAINDNELKRKTPQLQAYYNDPKVRSHSECSCIVGSCAGQTADQVARNIQPGTGYCCSPLNPMYQDPRIREHICYAQQKPKPLNGFGGGKRYDQIFKNVCPQAYSWEFDDHKSTFECSGKEATMEVKFC